MDIQTETADRMVLTLPSRDADFYLVVLPLAATLICGVCCICIFDFSGTVSLMSKLTAAAVGVGAVAYAVVQSRKAPANGRLVLVRSRNLLRYEPPKDWDISPDQRTLASFSGITYDEILHESEPGEPKPEKSYRIYLSFKGHARLLIDHSSQTHPDANLDIQRLVAWIDSSPRAATLQYPDMQTGTGTAQRGRRARTIPQSTPSLTIKGIAPPTLLMSGAMLGVYMLLRGFDSPGGQVALGGLLLAFGCGFLLAIWETLDLTCDTDRRELRITRRTLFKRFSKSYPLEHILSVQQVGRDVVLLRTNGPEIKIGNGLLMPQATKTETINAVQDWINTTPH